VREGCVSMWYVTGKFTGERVASVLSASAWVKSFCLWNYMKSDERGSCDMALARRDMTSISLPEKQSDTAGEIWSRVSKATA
jgi:hypothetical protein